MLQGKWLSGLVGKQIIVVFCFVMAYDQEGMVFGSEDKHIHLYLPGQDGDDDGEGVAIPAHHIHVHFSPNIFKKIGHGIKHAAKDVASGVKSAAKEVASKAKDAADIHIHL